MTFNCATRDDPFIDWVVVIPAIMQRRFDTSSETAVTELTARGFILGDLIESEEGTEFRINLTVPVLKEHNNTKVFCRTFGLEVDFSNPASLKILGELLISTYS